MPQRCALWLAFAFSGLALQGCAEKAAPQAPQPRLFATDMQGAAKSCSAPKPVLAPGKEAVTELRLGNDGGWCAISVSDDGSPYAAGLLTVSPMHGDVYIHPVGNDTRIDYTPDRGFAGSDAFTVELLPGSPTLRVTVTVTR